MNQKSSFKVFWGMIFVFLLLSFAYAQVPYLLVQREDGSSLYQIALTDNPCWMMRWNHSVTGVIVTDFYCWIDGKMVLTHSHTPSFDAGLGHIPGRGRQASDGFGGYFIYDINEAVPTNSYVLRVGSMKVNHRIDYEGKTYSLSELAEHERVVIKVVMP
jgi:hypothetical protein